MRRDRRVDSAVVAPWFVLIEADLPLGVGEIGGDDLVARAAEAELHQPDDLREGDAHRLRLVLRLIVRLQLQRWVLGEFTHL